MTPVSVPPDPYQRLLKDHRRLKEEFNKLKSVAELMYGALDKADDDIREHLQVAKYNLYGQINSGEFIGKPNPPITIHEHGIKTSLEVINSIRFARKAYRDTLTEEDIRLQEMDKLK